MAKILITGGAGFTGTNAADRYLEGGHEVVVFDSLVRDGALENLAWLRDRADPDRLTIIVGDVRFPPDALREEIESSDLVLHLAGQVAVTTSVVDPRNDFETNALGTLNILELVRESAGNRPTVLFSSTNKVYGGMEDLAVVESGDRYTYRDLPEGVPESRGLDFHSPYGCSKGCADQYVRDYSRIYGLKTVVFRQSCIYGYRQFGVEDQGWVAWFTIAAVLGKDLTIYGDGKQVRDVLFIEDLLAAYDAAWRNIDQVAGRVYNIGGGPGNVLSLRELLAFLSDRLGRAIEADRADWRPGDQRVYISDIRSAAEDLGWRPRVGWEDGVGRLLAWVQEHEGLLARMTASS